MKPLANGDRCLARKEMNLMTAGAELVTIECKDAAIMDDGREIFVINSDMHFMSYTDGFCMNRVGAKISLGACAGPGMSR